MSKSIMQAFTRGLFSRRTGSLRRRRVAPVILIAAVLVALPIGPFAHSAFGARSLTILREFGVLYGAENKQHFGVDVGAENGEAVFAPVQGVVSFVGRVPGSVGLGIMAVTVKTHSGDLVTLSPLAHTGVKAGDALPKGETIGVVAATGDPSSSDTHVHIGMRVAGKYVDPAGLVSAILSRVTAEGTPDAKVPAQKRATVSANAAAVPALNHAEAAVDGASNVTVPSTRMQSEPSAQVQSDVLDVSSSTSYSSGEVSVAHAILLEEAKAGVGTSMLSGAPRLKDRESIKVVRVHDAAMVPSLSAGQLAVCIFLIGISLTLAGVQVVKMIGEKSDLIGWFEHLAVRGHR